MIMIKEKIKGVLRNRSSLVEFRGEELVRVGKILMIVLLRRIGTNAPEKITTVR